MAYILVAEDEIPINDLICKNLKLLGYKTAQAFDGPEALGLAEKENFDLVLLDVMLPGMSGFQVKTRLAKDLSVIFVTAKTSVSDQLTGLNLGAEDYITKPFDTLVLIARVENVLRRTKKMMRFLQLKIALLICQCERFTKTARGLIWLCRSIIFWRLLF